MLRKILLGCGVVSSVLYVATDIIAARRYEDGYSLADQWFSELTAAGAPTRSFMVALNVIPYTALVTAFAAGVWTLPGPRRAARFTGAMLIGYAAAGVMGGLVFPMASRGTDATLRNVMHIPATAAMSLFILLAMGCGATILGRRFKYYSYATIAILIVFGILTSLQADQIAENQPTPWAGLEERINIYATMLWIAALAIALLHAEGALAPRRTVRRTIIPRRLQELPR